ncbi:MAG TPA: 30S ribosomal protein S17 [Bacteroidota bacterium]|nr:30S ribosomal protein S17 [Bacteroidota bacterium]
MEENILNNIEGTSSTTAKTRKRVLQGVVVSDKADKTIVIKVERQIAHPLYKKYYKRSKKFMAHDERNEAKEGDKVRIQESRPLSAKKRWALIEIVERAK